MDTPDIDEPAVNYDIDEYELYVEALTWFEFDQDEVSGMVFKAKQINIQQVIKKVQR